MKRYTEEHEWIEVRGDIATVGITAHAAKELGDITFVELPEVGTEFDQGDAFATVESVKTAAEVYCPVSGEVTEVNSRLEEQPEIVNDSPEHDGWICRLKGFKLKEIEVLMTEYDYEEFLHQ